VPFSSCALVGPVPGPTAPEIQPFHAVGARALVVARVLRSPGSTRRPAGFSCSGVATARVAADGAGSPPAPLRHQGRHGGHQHAWLNQGLT
jgi:hypothetical protein